MITSALLNRRFCYGAATVLVMLSVTVGMVDSKAPRAEPGKGNDKATQDGVSLRIATVVNAPATTLAFTLVNNGKEEIKTWPLGLMPHNRLIVVKPDGQEEDLWVGVDSHIESI